MSLNTKILKLAAVLACVYLTVPKLGYAQSLFREAIADALTPYALNNQFPPRLDIANHQSTRVEYTFDKALHAAMAKVYLQYQPDYACFVAMDAKTGAIINLTSFLKEEEPIDNLALRAEYPAASVFKFVTAAAALDTNKLSPSSVIPFNGKSTTLYKKQVLAHTDNKWTRRPDFVEAFAKSINPVFGRVGARVLGKPVLSDYASRFGFGAAQQSDVKIPMSRIDLSFDEQWELVEAGSGYTRDIRLNPIHAAQMMTALFNQGNMVAPFFVNSVASQHGELLYSAQPQTLEPKVMDASTTEELKQLMRATVSQGSARRSYSDISRYRVYRGIDIGGKTGSLTGYSPRGRHDWFVGYASKDDHQIVFASLIVNKEKWYVRSAYVARQFIYHYFKQVEDQQMSVSQAN